MSRVTPHHPPPHHHPRRKRQKSRLSRRTKTFIHLGLLVLIAASLWHEGGGRADWLFVALGFAVEVV